jgi:hypothetical protein
MRIQLALYLRAARLTLHVFQTPMMFGPILALLCDLFPKMVVVVLSV